MDQYTLGNLDMMDKSNRYINEFFDLTCYPDILDILNPISGRKKEITEAMAVIKYIRRLALKSPDKKFLVYDFCAGNALTSTIATFLYPNVESYAIDLAIRDREWDRIQGFNYVQSDIYKDNWKYMISQMRVTYPLTEVIVVGVHPCRGLANRIIEIYNESNADHLILMPCCTGDNYKYSLPTVIKEKVGDYLTWCVYLLNLVEGKKRMVVDENCLSPKNALIIGDRS